MMRVVVRLTKSFGPVLGPAGSREMPGGRSLRFGGPGRLRIYNCTILPKYETLDNPLLTWFIVFYAGTAQRSEHLVPLGKSNYHY